MGNNDSMCNSVKVEQGIAGASTPQQNPMEGTGCTPNKSINCNDPIFCEQKEKMRRKLQFFFMNPIEKWKARRKFPYKFVVQVI